LLGWLKEKMEERLDSCGYAMRYGKEYNQENIVATKYLLKMIDRSFTITEQNLVAIRDAWKVLLLDDFHLEWLKEYLLYETKSESERLARFDTTAMPISKGVDESKCGLAIMKHLLEIIDGSLVN
jgi:hypothetical protein